MKIAVTNYTGDRGNWGCQATSHNLVEFLKQTFSAEADLQITTVPFPKGHRIDKYIEAVHGDRIRQVFSSPKPSEADLSFLSSVAYERFGDFVDFVRTADVVVFQGEGSIGAPGTFRSIRVFALPFLAKHLWKKPVISMNQTICAASVDDIPVLKNAFQEFDIVAVREAASYRFAKKIGLDQTVLCPDMAFRESHAGAERIATTEHKDYFCISGSASMQLYDQASFVALIGRIARKFEITPIFNFSRQKDAAILDEHADKLADVEYELVLSEDYPNVESIIPMLTRAKFVFGGRYHTSVTALSQATPVVMLPGNTFKSEGIGDMLGIDCDVYGQDQEEEIFDRIQYIMDNQAQVRADIRAAIVRMRDNFPAMSQYILDVVEFANSIDGTKPIPSSVLTPELSERPENGRFDAIYNNVDSAAFSIHRWIKVRLTGIARKNSKFRASVHRTLTEFT